MENERIREEIRKKMAEGRQHLVNEGSEPRRNMKKVMKLAQRRVKLTQKLNIRILFVGEMINLCQLAVEAKKMNISCENDPDIFKQEALKYAKMFGDMYIHLYNSIPKHSIA